MCGIGGCVLKPGTTMSSDRLEAMRDALGHRGPDDSGIEVLGNVALVHTRLSIVDLTPRGHQPMRHPNGDWWLSYNGEIYNHDQIRRKLPDAHFSGTSDTETLLWALSSWGLDAIPRLTGQFAFAALDRRGGSLILCRDRFGIKPLYIAQAPDGVWFASEPQALFAAGISTKPADDLWESVLAGSYLGGESTLLQGLSRVDAGTSAVISLSDASVSFSRWHHTGGDVEPDRAERLGRLSRRQLTTELENTMRSTVQSSLLADATVGSLCSGGVDSSLITALAAEAKPDMVAFAASFKGDGPLDEGPAARRAAAALGIQIEVVDVTADEWLRDFVATTVHHGSPIANASAVTVYKLAVRARQCGVKVLMTGEGADELFGGYANIYGAELERFLPLLQRRIRRLEPKLLGDPRRFLDPKRVARKFATVFSQVGGQQTPVTETAWWPRLRPAVTTDSLEAALHCYAHHGGERQQLEARLLSRIDYTLAWLLNRMDKNVMQASVEARVPFLEPDVVSLALNLPLESRVGPWSKGILRDVARRVLPWQTAHRPKIYGMDYDAGGWIERSAQPEFLADGVLRDIAAASRDDFAAFTAASDTTIKMRLWSAEVWLRSAVEGHGIPRIEQDIWR